MAELKISSATYGRDASGAAKLKDQILKKLDDAKEAVAGKDLDTLKKTVRTYWAGVDADKFIAEIESKVNTMNNDFGKYRAMVEAAFENDAKSFAGMQNANASNIIK